MAFRRAPPHTAPQVLARWSFRQLAVAAVVVVVRRSAQQAIRRATMHGARGSRGQAEGPERRPRRPLPKTAAPETMTITLHARHRGGPASPSSEITAYTLFNRHTFNKYTSA